MCLESSIAKEDAEIAIFRLAFYLPRVAAILACFYLGLEVKVREEPVQRSCLDAPSRSQAVSNPVLCAFPISQPIVASGFQLTVHTIFPFITKKSTGLWSLFIPASLTSMPGFSILLIICSWYLPESIEHGHHSIKYSSLRGVTQ